MCSCVQCMAIELWNFETLLVLFTPAHVIVLFLVQKFILQRKHVVCVLGKQNRSSPRHWQQNTYYMWTPGYANIFKIETCVSTVQSKLGGKWRNNFILQDTIQCFSCVQSRMRGNGGIISVKVKYVFFFHI